MNVFHRHHSIREKPLPERRILREAEEGGWEETWMLRRISYSEAAESVVQPNTKQKGMMGATWSHTGYEDKKMQQ